MADLDVLDKPAEYFDRTEAIDHDQLEVLINMQKIRDGKYQDNKLWASYKVKQFGLDPEEKEKNEIIK